MCLAIYKPAGVDIPTENLHQGWVKNSDGGGFAYVKGKRVVVSKGHMMWKDWIEAWDKAIKANPKSPFLAHFRIRSMGDRGPEHTHPYSFKHGVMIHNGSLRGTGAVYGTGPSDTQKFLEAVGDNFTKEATEKHKLNIGNLIGYNKLVFLYPDKSHVIINEIDGVWDQGVWYSNRSYKNWRQPHE